MGGSLGAKGMSAVALQTRLIQSMIQEVPEKDAFLFRTVEKLHLINHETGEVLWDIELEKTTDIRDMLLRDDNIIVRLSSQLPDTMSGSVSNILGGGVKDLEFYAFNQEDGTLDWQLSEPFKIM